MSDLNLIVYKDDKAFVYKLVKIVDKKRCPTCGKDFFFQSGRSKKGQFRKDAKYCSSSCSREGNSELRLKSIDL